MANAAQSVSPTPPTTDLQARVKALEAERDALRARADAAEARSATLESEGSTRQAWGDKEAVPATRSKPTWPFKVIVKAKPKGHPEIAPKVIDAVDESEAIRMYCLLNRDEKERQLDPTRYQFEAVCQDPQRAINLLEKQRHRRGVMLGHEDPRPRGQEHDKSKDTRINRETRQPVVAS